MRQIALTLALIGLSTSAVAAPSQAAKDARQAYDRGDFAAARKGCEKPSREGDAECQYLLALTYLEGKGVAADPKQGLTLLKEAAQGSNNAAVFLGSMYEEGKGVARDEKEAMRLFQSAAKRNPEAFNKLRSAAEAGSAEAQFALGKYYKGRYVTAPAEVPEGIRWIHKAAEQGHVEAQLFLGTMYEFGKGVPVDQAAATPWLRKAAEAGIVDAQVILGHKYANGEGVGRDGNEAFKWLRKANDAGSPAAQFEIGQLYAKGVGVAQDDREALKWYQRAADRGDWNANYQIGQMYEAGRGGLPQDPQRAMGIYRQYGATPDFDRLSCKLTAKAEIYGIKLMCATREQLTSALAGIGATISEDTANGAIYTGKGLPAESSELRITYNATGAFAAAEYTFPAKAGDAGVISRVRDSLQAQYGAPGIATGDPAVTSTFYRWMLPDGIEIRVTREGPDTSPTHLLYVHAKRYGEMHTLPKQPATP